MIDEYLRLLARRLPATQRSRVLAEAEDHLRQAADSLAAGGLDRDAAEAEAVRAFGSADEVAARVAPLLAGVAVRRAAVLGALAAAALVVPLYGIPENTLPPAPWAERPELLSISIAAGVVAWLLATGLGVTSIAVARRWPRASAALLAASALATLTACVAACAGLIVWRSEADVGLGWQPFLALPVSLAAAVAALGAAAWSHDRAGLARH